MAERKPPSDIEAERALLGTLLVNAERLPDVIMMLRPSEFYENRNREIFQEIIMMDIEKQPIDIALLATRMDGKVSSAYIASLSDGCLRRITKELIESYVEQIKNTARLRRLISHSELLIEQAYKGDVKATNDTLQDVAEFTKPDRRMSDEIRNWITLSDGSFSLNDIRKDLKILSKSEFNLLNQVVHMLKKEGVIEKYGAKGGVYRKVNKEIEVLDWQNADDKEYPIELPFDLTKLTFIYPKSIICVAGLFNAGKTTFCLETVRMNQDRQKINYFTSEMGSHKLRQRLKKFENVPFPDGWKFNAIYRASNWSDCLADYPDDINIIDYLQLGEKLWLVGDVIDSIFNKLNRGVAIICLQKTLGRDLGRGGDFSAERASLYLSIDPGRIKIVKAKEWRGTDNPNGKIKQFKLVQGWKFVPDPDWISEDVNTAYQQTGKGKRQGYLGIG